MRMRRQKPAKTSASVLAAVATAMVGAVVALTTGLGHGISSASEAPNTAQISHVTTVPQPQHFFTP